MDWLAFALNQIARIPFEKVLFPRPDHTKALQDFAASVGNPVSQNRRSSAEGEESSAALAITPQTEKEAAYEEKMTLTTPPTDKPIVAKAGTGCRGCTAKHFGKCAGALSEAIDFSRAEGMESTEVEKRLAFCEREMETWEGIDATPESFVSLSDERKVWVRKWLPTGRGFRHQLNSIKTMEDLEQVAARAGELHLQARKELRELGELEDKDSGFLDEVQRQAKRVKEGELTKEQAVKEIEEWQKSVKA